MILIGEGKYNINHLKEIKVTEDYLGLDQNLENANTTNLFKIARPNITLILLWVNVDASHSVSNFQISYER